MEFQLALEEAVKELGFLQLKPKQTTTLTDWPSSWFTRDIAHDIDQQALVSL